MRAWPTPGTALAWGVERLRAAGVDDPSGDVRWLMAHALGVPRDRLTLHLGGPLTEAAAEAFRDAVVRRSRRVPMGQVLGRRSFWGRNFSITPDVLDPRPETEVLVALALAAPFSRVLDLGTGSGCILISLLADRPGATGLGVDRRWRRATRPTWAFRREPRSAKATGRRGSRGPLT
jgi:release factor glutamine methyltransferase